MTTNDAFEQLAEVALADIRDPSSAPYRSRNEKWYRNRELMTNLDEMIIFVIYGDIWECPLEVLGAEGPTSEEFEEMDIEQQLRVQIAASLVAYRDGKLSKNGQLYPLPEGDLPNKE